MDINLTPPQSEFFSCKSEHVAAVAGFASGKSEASIVSLLSTMIQNPGVDMGYFAPTYGLIRDIFYPRISDKLDELGIMHKINKSEHIVSIQGLGNIFCRSMDSPGQIVGFEIGDAFIDELDILAIDKALESYRKISARCRIEYKSGKVNQKKVTTTPEGFKSTYQLFKNICKKDSENNTSG